MIEYSSAYGLIAAFYNGGTQGSVKCSGAREANSIRCRILVGMKRKNMIPEGMTVRILGENSSGVTEFALVGKIKTKRIYQLT